MHDGVCGGNSSGVHPDHSNTQHSILCLHVNERAQVCMSKTRVAFIMYNASQVNNLFCVSLAL